MNELTELMTADPMRLSKSPEERAIIIEYYRENRVRFIQGNKSAGKAPKEKAPKLSLLDLDI